MNRGQHNRRRVWIWHYQCHFFIQHAFMAFESLIALAYLSDNCKWHVSLIEVLKYSVMQSSWSWITYSWWLLHVNYCVCVSTHWQNGSKCSKVSFVGWAVNSGSVWISLFITIRRYDCSSFLLSSTNLASCKFTHIHIHYVKHLIIILIVVCYLIITNLFIF